MKSNFIWLILFYCTVSFSSDNVKVNLHEDREFLNKGVVNLISTKGIYLKGPIIKYRTTILRNELLKLAQSSTRDINFIIESPGGEVSAGMDLIEGIQIAKAIYKKNIICYINKEAASMAAMLQAFCSTTYIQKTGYLMFHQASYGFEGEHTRVKRRVDFMDAFLFELNDSVAKQLGLDVHTLIFLSHDELWLSGTTAARQGFVDGIFEAVHHNFVSPNPSNNIIILGRRFIKNLLAKLASLL